MDDPAARAPEEASAAGETQMNLPPLQEPPAERSSVVRRRKGGRRPFRFWRFVQTVLSIGAMVGAALLGAAFLIVLAIYNSLSTELSADLERLESLSGLGDFETTRIYDRDGNLLNELFGEGRRTEITFEDIPQAVQDATIATEDDSFYENPGFDPASIARAASEWYQEGEIVSGGSTITQQLVRLIVFDPQERAEQTLRRKLKEVALAWVMTQRFSKQDILEMYLNTAYYGNLAYGIEGAADVYFGKSAADLTVGEATFLVGLPQDPVDYDPYANFELAKGRQRQVLDLMVLHEYITQAEADAIYAQAPLSAADLTSPEISLLAPHFTVEVRRQLAEETGIDPALLARGGLEVYTTLDMEYQALAEEIAARHVAEVQQEFNLNNAALVAIRPATGEVLAMLGSVDYNDASIDGNVNVILSLQQPGSTMKPLTYAAAIERGWNPSTIIWDVPMAYPGGLDGPYEPVNYDGRFHGPVRLRDALANSYNIPAVTALRTVGVDGLLEINQRFGVQSLGQDAGRFGLSLTLGGGEVTPLEMTAAYGVFANQGRYVAPHLINRVIGPDGEVLYEVAPPAEVEPVLDPRIAYMVSDILSDNDARAPAMGAQSPLLTAFPSAAKTGTTNDYRDNWTIGYTPHLLVGVWAGNTDNSPMAEGTGGLTGAAPIWQEYMAAIYADPELASLLAADDLPPLGEWYQPPAGLEERPVCVLSSLNDPQPAAEGCPRTRLEWFLSGPAASGPLVGATPLPTATALPTATPTLLISAPLPGDQPAPEAPTPPERVEVEPGLWVISVLPLTEEYLPQVIAALPGLDLPEGTPDPLPPRYCEVGQAYTGGQGVALQMFIAAPEDPIDAIRARNWAYQNGVPIVPGAACPQQVAEEITRPVEPITDAGTGALYAIDWPRPGAQVYGVRAVTGTARFDPAQVQYYKVEIGAGDFPNEWLTLGDVHTDQVEGGELEVLHADALPPGNYVLRLVLVSTANTELMPLTVPITIIPEPTATPPS